jgi:glutathione S-transferase
MVWDVFVERVSVPREGGVSDEEKVAAGLRTAGTCLAVLKSFMGKNDYLVGSRLTLADLHAAPMITYFRQAPEGAEALSCHPTLAKWWERLAERPSLKAVLD